MITIIIRGRGGFFVGFPIPRTKIPIPWDFIKKSGIKIPKKSHGIENPGISGKSQINPKDEKMSKNEKKNKKIREKFEN